MSFSLGIMNVVAMVAATHTTKWFYMSIEKANAHISSCLYYLSRELDPLLTKLLAQKEFMPQKVLEEHGWTIILKIHDENRKRLRHPNLYNPKDLQVQLRMFTEAVGTPDNKFPFEPDGARKVRTYAQDLRIFRNKSAHYVDLDRNDALVFLRRWVRRSSRPGVRASWTVCMLICLVLVRRHRFVVS